MTVWQSQEFDGHEQICFFTDQEAGLRAVVAIHSTALGPAAGGTRFKSYESDDLALDDALRLSRAMSYKSALAGLPIGGGKAVIIGDPSKIKTRELLHAYGRFINRVGQVFSTGEDVGISGEDVKTMHEVTPYVGGHSATGAGDPSIHTATGVMHGLRAVIEHKLGQKEFAGLRFAVQGLGAVGWGVAQRLHARGAKLVITDIRPELVEKAVALFGAESCPLDSIHAADVDVYVPCALGGVVTDKTAQEIRAAAVAGAANNQLLTPSAGVALWERGILYAPDYVMNAGGIASALEELQAVRGSDGKTIPALEERLAQIYSRLTDIFQRSQKDNIVPEIVAEQTARRLIGR